MHIASVIEIVSTPQGGAPEWVRKSWVGCVFPCEPECGHLPTPSWEIGSSAVVFVDGYDVPQDIALQVLAHLNPKAAEWFYARDFPAQDRAFRFMKTCTKVVREVAQDDKRKLVVWDDIETGTYRPRE